MSKFIDIRGNVDSTDAVIKSESFISMKTNEVERFLIANNGDIVVALVDGEEVTLKRFQRRDGKIILIPENDEYKEQVYSPEQVQIQGKLASLMRTYH